MLYGNLCRDTAKQDVLRYVLCANAPESKDNDFTWKDFQDRTNNELVSVFGNFVNRAFVLMHKLCGGKVPRLHEDVIDHADTALINDIKNAAPAVHRGIHLEAGSGRASVPTIL